MNRMTAHAGLTYVDFMMGMFLSVFIFYSISHFFMVMKQVQDKNRMRQSAQREYLALSQTLRDEIHMAGFTPCGNISALKSSSDLFAMVLKPYQFSALESSDLEISRMMEPIVRVTRSSNPYQVETTADFFVDEEQDILIADCFHAELKRLSTLHQGAEKTVISFQKPLRYSYRDPIYLGPWGKVRFFMKANHSGQQALYYQWHHLDEWSSAVTGFKLDVLHQNPFVLQLSLMWNHLTEKKLILSLRSP